MKLSGLALAAVASAWSAAIPDCRLVPGWKQQGAARRHDPGNLFEYMNGNAEGYLIYGFRSMSGITCENAGSTILIDISEMTDSDSAYGIYTANSDPAKPGEKIGMAGQVLPRRAVFVKGNYYVELAANPEKDHTAALRAFAAEMEKRMEGRTELPEALGWFPQERLSSLRLVPESVLGLRLLKRGYVAQYEGGGKSFVSGEASAEAAAAVMTKLRARLGQTQPATLADEAFHAEDKYLGSLDVFRKGRWIGGCAGTGSPARASVLAARMP